MKKRCFVLLVLGTMSLMYLPTLAGDPPALPAVTGVLGLELAEDPGWLAVRLDVPEVHALSGILWYNNDGLVTYPVLVAGTGFPDGPGGVAAMETLATDLDGPSSGWREFTFPEPIAASQGGLYLVFEFPADHQFTFAGAGGGAAIGYCAPEAGSPGWLSGDGETWMHLAQDTGFALVPQFVPYEDGMLVKRLGDGGAVVPPPVTAAYLAAGPNPFNPETEIRFGLPSQMKVTLDIFDLRGALVRRLVQETLPQGHHTARWSGRDGADRVVASGVYFARLEGQDVHLTRRVMLVK